MTQFQDLPAEKVFGHGFNYAAWSGNTTISLHKVTWDSSYKDVWRPNSPAAFEDFLATQTGPVITTTASYAPLGRPVRLQIPFELANTYNYLRAYNPAQPINGGDTGRAYYYFVSSVNYVAPDTTELILQLDVWATYWNTTVFGRCFIEQSHAGIANQNRMADYGREFLTVPEGFDLGSEYQIVDQWKRHISKASGDYSIMVTSTVDLTIAPGTVDNPVLQSARGSNFENLPNGASLYLFDTLTEFKDFMSLYSDKPWVTQGIINIMAIPDNEDYLMEYDETTVTVNGFPVTFKALKGTMVNRHFHSLKENWRNYLPLPDRYAHLDKFKVHPYTALEMTAYTGTPISIKPESWANPDAIVQEMPHFAPPGARLSFVPYRYNAAGAYDPAYPDLTDYNGDIHDDGEFLDFATGIYNFPMFSIVNNGYMSFLASNTNSIAFQHSNADWSQQRALTGADVQANQAGANIDASKSINAMGMTAAGQSATLANETAGWQALQAGGNSIIGGIEKGASGGVAGGVVSAVKGGANAAADYAIGMNNRNRQLGITTGLMGSTNTRQNQAAEYTRDTNLDYAQYAAKGDYQNAIAGINARVQDARMIQPTTSGQVGGEAFNLAVYKWGYDVKVKMLQGAVMAAIGEYWLRYGYKVNRYGTLPADLAVMSKFTYWKLKESYIVSAECPEVYKNTMRGIFEKGVTVWKNPTDIGNIDTADNAPLAGVTL